MQYIYTCATNFLHVNQRWLPFLVGRSVGCPLNCPLYPYLKVVGCPLSCTLSCPLYPYMEVVGSLICMAKFPWAAHGQPHGQPTPMPTELLTFSHLEVVGCPLLPYMEVVGSLICIAKFPWAAHGQPTPLPTELPTVSIYGSSGHPTELPTELPTVSIYGSSGLPTELPTVSIYGSSGQPNLHGKIPMGSPRAAHSVAHVQPTGSEVGSSPVFSVWGYPHSYCQWHKEDLSDSWIKDTRWKVMVILGYWTLHYFHTQTQQSLHIDWWYFLRYGNDFWRIYTDFWVKTWQVKINLGF